MKNKDFTMVDNTFVDRLSEFSGSEVKVYLAIKRHVNEGKNNNRTAWPSEPQLAAITGLAKGTVSLCVNRLAEKGVFSMKHRFNKSIMYDFDSQEIRTPHSDDTTMPHSDNTTMLLRKSEPNSQEIRTDSQEIRTQCSGNQNSMFRNPDANKSNNKSNEEEQMNKTKEEKQYIEGDFFKPLKPQFIDKDDLDYLKELEEKDRAEIGQENLK